MRDKAEEDNREKLRRDWFTEFGRQVSELGPAGARRRLEEKVCSWE
ncbi:hypothetical protein ABIA39_002738 [Nocardia sp. GAS34]